VATAEREWLPLESAVVFREKPNGALVTAAPEFAPSTLNCTLVTLEDTLVETATVPETFAPDTGEVIEMDGAEKLFTVIVTMALVVERPLDVLATAASEWLPLVSVVVFREKLNGAVVTVDPELLPSTMNWTSLVLEDTLVVIGTVPERVAPGAGEVIETLGAPALATTIETAELDVD